MWLRFQSNYVGTLKTHPHEVNARVKRVSQRSLSDSKVYLFAVIRQRRGQNVSGEDTNDLDSLLRAHHADQVSISPIN